jgi:eukaryotic-like serine/threonine-protein kinase
MGDAPDNQTQPTTQGAQGQQNQGSYDVGDVIATRYEVLKLLGRGGMGVVYLVHDRKHDRKIALKTLLPQYAANKRAIGRFVREVNAVRKLDHPGIIKILDARQYKDLLYYTMEYVEGVRLRDYMRKRGKLGLGSTVRILSLLAKALEHAHEVTIHRDLSPENVMLMSNATVKLLDFGLAKLEVPNDPCFTMVGANLGRIQYKAPEQHQDASHVDKRADIYPLGVMFFEMLVGRLPRGYEPVTEQVPSLPGECDEFLRKAMAPNPDDRFSDAGAFRAALKNLYEVSKSGVRPVVRPSHVAKDSLLQRIKAALRRFLKKRLE